MATLHLTCQEYEEQTGTVKQNKLHQQDDANEPLAVTRHHVVHHEVEHRVEVDGYQADGYPNDVVKVVKTDKVSTGLISRGQVDYLHSENEKLVEEEQFGSQNHQVEVHWIDRWLSERKEADKWRGSNWQPDIVFIAEADYSASAVTYFDTETRELNQSEADHNFMEDLHQEAGGGCEDAGGGDGHEGGGDGQEGGRGEEEAGPAGR